MRVDPVSAEIIIYSFRDGSRKFEPMFSYNVGKFRDPMGRIELTNAYEDGKAMAVRDWIRTDPRMDGILDSCLLIATDRITHGEKKFISIGFHDFHARWISRAVAEVVADHLSKDGYAVAVIHEHILK